MRFLASLRMKRFSRVLAAYGVDGGAAAHTLHKQLTGWYAKRSEESLPYFSTLFKFCRSIVVYLLSFVLLQKKVTKKKTSLKILSAQKLRQQTSCAIQAGKAQLIAEVKLVQWLMCLAFRIARKASAAVFCLVLLRKEFKADSSTSIDYQVRSSKIDFLLFIYTSKRQKL